MERLTARHFRFADFELDGARRLLLRRGEPVPLNSRTFDLLLALVEHRGEVLSKRDLLDRVWSGQIVEEGNLTVQISTLRKVFGERKDDHQFIVTMPGRGYSFVADVTEAADAEIVVESHSRSHIVIEQREVDERPAADADIRYGTAVSSKIAAWLSADKRFLALAGFLVLLLAGAYGFWSYLQTKASRPLAQAWIAPGKAARPQQITTNGKVSLAALSPDGEYFAYTVGQTDRPSLWYAHTNGRQQMQIRPPEPVSYASLTFGPDGTEVYYIARSDRDRSGSLFRLPVLGGTPQKVVSNIDSQVTFSPDGKQLAFVRLDAKRKLSVLTIADTADGTNQREVATRDIEKRFKTIGVSWSPDGKSIAVGVVGTRALDEEIYLVNVETGSAEKFGSMSFHEVRRLAWLKDGTGLFVNAIEKTVWDDRHLWLLAYPGGDGHKVTQDLFHYGMYNLSVSDDGTKLLSVSSTKVCNIFVSRADDLTRAKKITGNSLGKLPGSEGIAWTADNRIVYGAFFDKNQTLSVMDADGSNARQLTSPGFLDMLPTVTPDNKWVVFNSTRGGGWRFWGIGPDGGELKELAIGEPNKTGVSANNEWILYPAKAGEDVTSIWRSPISGGEPVRLTFQQSNYPQISPDGKMFACSYSHEGRTRLAVFPISGGEPLYIFDVPPRTTFNVGLRWTPDGRSVVYRNGVASLWQQRLTGGEPQKLLEFPDEVIYSFGWSHDGRQFAVAHGEDIRDVVLITNHE